MVTVFAEGLLPSVGVGCVEAAFAGVSVLSLVPNMSATIKKPPPPPVLPRDGGGSVGLSGVGYDARPAFIARCSYLPRYSAACMAMMRPELLAQEACEPGARETS